MGFTSIWHWLIVLVIILLLFGAGKLPKVMGDLAKGIKNFKAGMNDENDESTEPSKRIDADHTSTVNSNASAKDEAAKS